MKSSKALPWLPALLVLAGCPGQPPEPHLDKVSVTCTPSTLVAGQSAQCSASALDQDGQPFTVSSYTWSSGDETIAHVDASGTVSTVVVASGDVAIRASATSGDKTAQGEASLSVTAKPPTVHSAPVTSAETWRASDNPHLVSAALTVDAALTLEAGTVIRFAPGAELRVTRGPLLASGTAEAPILLQAPKGAAPGAWKGVVFTAKEAASSFEHVTLSGCGGAQGEGACLVIRDGATPVLKDVTMRDSAALGVLVATADSAFGPGSTRLSVFNSAAAAVRLDANQADSVPTGGSFSGNTPNAVELTGTSVTRTQAWPNPSIPYVVKERLSVGHPTTLATLTVSPGTQVRFGPNTHLVVGSTGDIKGGLVLDGTAEAPILLTADANNQPGYWRGVHVQTSSANAGRISHATIEFAGKESGNDDASHPGNGNLNLYGGITETSSFIVTDVIVQKSSGPGFYLSDGGEFGAGSARLTSRDNATYPIRMEPYYVTMLPRDFDFRNNGLNMVALSGGGLVDTQTWTNLGLPYLLTGAVIVGHKTNPTLTIAPGTEIRAARDSAILVGYLRGRPGALVAKGTAEAPIRFLPDSPSAPNGYWMGLHFYSAMGSALDHVLVTHGGALSTDFSDIVGSGNLNVHVNIGHFVTNSTFKNARECAVTVDSSVVGIDFSDPSLNNLFTDNPNNSQCFN